MSYLVIFHKRPRQVVSFSMSVEEFRRIATNHPTFHCEQSVERQSYWHNLESSYLERLEKGSDPQSMSLLQLASHTQTCLSNPLQFEHNRCYWPFYFERSFEIIK